MSFFAKPSKPFERSKFTPRGVTLSSFYQSDFNLGFSGTALTTRFLRPKIGCFHRLTPLIVYSLFASVYSLKQSLHLDKLSFRVYFFALFSLVRQAGGVQGRALLNCRYCALTMAGRKAKTRRVYHKYNYHSHSRVYLRNTFCLLVEQSRTTPK